jgi:hypothetical protein
MPLKRKWITPAVCVPFALAGTLGCGGAMGQSAIQDGGATDKGGLLSSLQAPIAVGGSVRPALRLELHGSTPPSTHYISTRPGIIAVRDGVLEGRAPGMSAVLVANDQNVVLDFIHVWVKAANRLEVHRIDVDGADMGEVSEPVEMIVGESVRFVPKPYAGAELLTGVATSSWTVEPPIATVLREGLPGRCRILARNPGTATMKVSLLGSVASVQVKVMP